MVITKVTTKESEIEYTNSRILEKESDMQKNKIKSNQVNTRKEIKIIIEEIGQKDKYKYYTIRWCIQMYIINVKIYVYFHKYSIHI